jgi:predicted permease
MVDEVRKSGEYANVAAYSKVVDVIRDKEGQSWKRARIETNLLHLLGVSSIHGRGFLHEDGVLGSAPVALLSERVWRDRFGGDPKALNRSITLDDQSVRIIGVLPAGFTLPARDTEIWMPLVFEAPKSLPESYLDFGEYSVIGRMRQNHSRVAYQEQLRARYANDERLAWLNDMLELSFFVAPLQEAWGREKRAPLLLLGGATLLMLLSAVLNLVGLWMARWLGRGHELAVQAALGAGRRQALIGAGMEYLLLAAGGLALAVMVAGLGIRALYGLKVLDSGSPVTTGAGLPALGLAAAFLLLAAIPVLAAVWWQGHRLHKGVAGALLTGGTTGRSAGNRTRRVLIVAQIALAVSLLSAVALLLKSWHALIHEDPGFRPEPLLMAEVLPQEKLNIEPGEKPPDRLLVPDVQAEATLERLRALPGVKSLAVASVVPFGLMETASSFELPDLPGVTSSARTRLVDADYFCTAGISIVSGRAFSAEDFGAKKPVVIVDEYFAEKYFQDGDAVGRRFRMSGGPDASYEVEILGIAKTVRHLAPDEAVNVETIYSPLAPLKTYMYSQILFNCAVPPATLIAPVKRILTEEIGPDRTGHILTMENLIRRTVDDREPQMILLGAFAGLTLLLAAVGLYALLNYAVRARTAEFGLRMAVGANSARIRGHVLRDGLRLLIPGLLLGVGGAYVAGRIVAERLYKVAPADPLTWLVVAAILTLVVLATALWPARRAARTSPMEALRYE